MYQVSSGCEKEYDKKIMVKDCQTDVNKHTPLFFEWGGYREYVYSVAVYQKYLTRLGELIIFEPWRENYHFSQPS